MRRVGDRTRSILPDLSAEFQGGTGDWPPRRQRWGRGWIGDRRRTQADLRSRPGPARGDFRQSRGPINNRPAASNPREEIADPRGGRAHDRAQAGGKSRLPRRFAAPAPEIATRPGSSGRIADARGALRPMPRLPRVRLRRVLRPDRRRALPGLRPAPLAKGVALAVRHRGPGPPAPGEPSDSTSLAPAAAARPARRTGGASAPDRSSETAPPAARAGRPPASAVVLGDVRPLDRPVGPAARAIRGPTPGSIRLRIRERLRPGCQPARVEEPIDPAIAPPRLAATGSRRYNNDY